MKPALSDLPLAGPPAVDAVPATTLEHRLDFSALGALFWLTLRQHARGRRLLVLCVLFSLPTLVAILIRCVEPSTPTDTLVFHLIFTLIPHALMPLLALLYASGMIQDEIEDQTLTYLLIRPLPKWALYVTKLLATLVVTALLANFFTTAAYVAIYWGKPDFWAAILPKQGLPTAGLVVLTVAAYCSIFGCMSLFTNRSLVAGVAYIILFEGVLANVDFVIRRWTVMYYFRVLTERWLGTEMKDMKQWTIDLNTAPGAWGCVGTLLGPSFIATCLAAMVFAGREFRVKTPEGS